MPGMEYGPAPRRQVVSTSLKTPAERSPRPPAEVGQKEEPPAFKHELRRVARGRNIALAL
jgi:hypothetical protein